MNIKKIGIVAACLALVASFALCGCSSNASTNTASSNTTEATEYELLTPGTLTIITSPDYPPFENLVNGEVEGYEIDLFQQVADKLNLELEIVPMQFDAIMPAIVAGGQGDVGVSGFSVDPERAKEIDFTASFYIDDQAVAVMNDSDITEENATEALNAEGVIIAVQTGTTGETFAQENFPNATIQGYGNSTDCFAAMQSGNATAVCTNMAVVDSMLSGAYTDAHIVYQSATGEEYAAVVAKDNPELCKAIDQALEELEAEGAIDDLKVKWFSAALA